MKKSKLILAAISCFGISLATASTNDHYRYVIFGDSLSDSSSQTSRDILSTNEDKHAEIATDFNDIKRTRFIGNNYWLNPANIVTLRDFWGAAVTSFDYSDENNFGKTWVNYLLHDTKIVNYRALSTNPQKYIKDSDYNLVFATASAQSGNRYVNDLDYGFNQTGAPVPYVNCESQQYGTIVGSVNPIACTPNVIAQVNKFIDLTKQNKITNFKNTRVIIWIGGNDINGNISKIFNIGKLNPKKIIEQLKAYHPSLLVNNIQTSVELLKSHGIPAKNIYVFGLPNFKYVPAVRELISGMPNLAQSTILGLLSLVSINYNYSIKNMSIHEGVNFFDVGKYFIDIIKHPDRYQNYFGEYATNDPLYICTETIDNPLNNTDNNFPLCKGFVFYNNIHPTTYTHKIVSDKFQKYLNKYSSDQK